MMKVVALFSVLMASALAFSPATFNARSSTALGAKAKKEGKTPFFESVFGMDLFAPNPQVNNYGQRNKKIKQGKVGTKSYVPDGLSLSQYQAVRSKDAAKAAKSYQKNVSKAGKFQDYTAFYKKRGTDTSDAWFRSPGRGHTFAKTKYDFSGGKDEQKTYDGAK